MISYKYYLTKNKGSMTNFRIFNAIILDMKRDITVYEWWLHFKHQPKCIELILNNTDTMDGYVPIPAASILEDCYNADSEQTEKCFIFRILNIIY